VKKIFQVSENGVATPTVELDRWNALYDAGETGEVDTATLTLLYRLFCSGYSRGTDEDFPSVAVAVFISAVLQERGVPVDSFADARALPFLRVPGSIVE
jgi:hypothetical protein